MSLGGAGLLSLLRGQPRAPAAASSDAASPARPAASDGGKFAARSDAVRAVEHAVAAGSSKDAHRSAARGRVVPVGAEYTYDVDAPVPGEAQVELEVSPITMLQSEYEQRHHRQIAVNGEFIAYGLKQGHVRVLCRNTTDRALCKGHSVPVSDMRFALCGNNLLASGSSGGQLIVWRLAHKGIDVSEAQVLNVGFTEGEGAAGGLPDMHLAWRPEAGSGPAEELAVGVGSHVVVFNVDPSVTEDKMDIDLSSDSPGGCYVVPGWTGEAVTALAYSPDGSLLAAGGQDGTVKVWQSGGVGAKGPLPLEVEAVLVSGVLAGAAVGALAWLPCADGWLLVAGNAANTELELWHAGREGVPVFRPLQRIKFASSNGQEFFNHVEAVPEAQLLVVANTPKNAIYTLHYSGAGAQTRVDYIASFKVAVPVLNFTTLWKPGGEGGDGGEAGAVDLFCVQTTAVQQYSLNPELCRPGEGEMAQAQERQQPVGAEASSLPQPSSQLATAFASAAAESELESTASAPVLPPGAEAATSSESGAAAESTPPAATAGTSSAAAAAAAASGATSPAASAAEPLHGEASIVDRVSVLPLQPFPEPPAEDAGGGSPPSDLEAISGIPTPEEPASPPSTPVAGHQISVPVPVPVSLPMRPPSPTRAPEPTHVPQPHMAPGPAPPPAPAALQPRLLTPGDVAAAQQAQQQQQQQPSPPGERPLRPAPPEHKPLHILQRPHPVAPAAGPAAAHSPGEHGVVGPRQAAAAAEGGADAEAVRELITEQLGGAHKKYVGHVSLMYRELLKAMRSELATQSRQIEAAVSAQVATALETSVAQVQQERAAVLAEERGNFERLLVAVSTTMNTDLPARLQEIVRAELGTVGGSVASAVAPAVQQAVQASLPKEVSGAVKAQLEKQLTASLQASLAKPLQEAFRMTFQKQLLPAFEGACQSMFAQINTTLAQGLQEHLQAAKAAAEEPAGLAAQLRASLAAASSLAADLSKERALLSQQLGRTSSITSPGASAPDVRAELSRDLKAGRYEEAFTAALGLQDLSTVVWLCGQLDSAAVLGQEPTPLSQMVLLSLVQQLASDLSGTGAKLTTKLGWIREAAMLINTADPHTSPHIRPVLDQVYSALQGCAARVHGADASQCKLAMHVVHSQLAS